MASGGTEAFPDLGKHCQLSECHQLDFLPFKCDGCRKVFCVEHRSYKSHQCPNSDHNSRKVLICETCSMSMEIPRNNNGGGQDAKDLILENHRKSGDCDPKKKKKPTCGVRRCKEILTFSNTSSCRFCRSRFCLKHRFQSDHGCDGDHGSGAVRVGGGGSATPFLVAWASRNGQDCTKKSTGSKSGSTPSTSVKAY